MIALIQQAHWHPSSSPVGSTICVALLLIFSLALIGCDSKQNSESVKSGTVNPVSNNTSSILLLNGNVESNTANSLDNSTPTPIETDPKLVSIGVAGIIGNSGSENASVSGDGRFVVFESAASNLVPNDLNGVVDIFIANLESGVVRLISSNSEGMQGNGNSTESAINEDGSVVAFKSFADNLVANDTNGTTDIFLKFTRTGETIRVSVSSTGEQSNNQSGRPSISGDGGSVVFESIASNLAVGDSNRVSDIFLHRVQDKTTTRVSMNTVGAKGDSNQIDQSSANAAISKNGKFIAFDSYAANLVGNDTNRHSDVFVFDVDQATVSRVSVSSDLEQGDAGSHTPSISGDGQYVSFISDASNLVENDTNGNMDVFLHDRFASTTKLISVGVNGESANDVSVKAVVDNNGEYIVFESFASNIVDTDTNNASDIFLKNLKTENTVLVSKSETGAYNSFSRSPSVSSDGRYIAFHSFATNISPLDNNIVADVLVADRVRLLDN